MNTEYDTGRHERFHADPWPDPDADRPTRGEAEADEADLNGARR